MFTRKIWITALFWQLCLAPFSRAQDSGYLKPRRSTEILRSGFLDVVTNGQVSASARLIRVLIGDPDGFAVPLSIYSGVTAGSLSMQAPAQGARSNDQLTSSLINPLSGLVNLSFDRTFPSVPANEITGGALTCQLGGRLLTGFRMGPAGDPLAGKPVNFFNSYGSAGFYFQTGAWEGGNESNLGIFWLSFRYISSYSRPETLASLFPDPPAGFYHGWSIGGGMEISDLVNIKVIYYKYVEEPELGSITPLCQFSFHYSL